MTERGRFVVLEGGEGSGKSTQATMLADARGALLTRQPGGTALGARLRELLLSSGAVGGIAPIDDRAEALMMAADRAQHVAEVIEPALFSGRDVVCDRFIGSSIAYQGFGRGLDVDIVRAVSGWAAAGLWPDVVVLLDVPEDVALGRTGGARDRIEAAGVDFHRRVADGFRAQAEDEPDTWVVVDGTGTVDEVHDRVLDAVIDVLGPGG
ncbi:MAG: dTMP kinase [Microthrixaceae bacterium]